MVEPFALWQAKETTQAVERVLAHRRVESETRDIDVPLLVDTVRRGCSGRQENEEY